MSTFGNQETVVRMDDASIQEKDQLKEKVNEWLKDDQNLADELTMLLEKWFPSTQAKGFKTSEEPKVEGSVSGSEVGEKKRKKIRRPLIYLRDKVTEALQSKPISHAVWRRSFFDGKIRRIGFLDKQGGKVKSWHRRLFVVRDHGLYYFATRKDFVIGAPPKGYMLFKDLNPTKTRNICQPLQLFIMLGRPYCFGITTSERTLVISARSKKEMNVWKETLEEAYTEFWRRYQMIPPNVETSPATEGQIMPLRKSQDIASVLEVIDLEEEQEVENLKKQLYLAKTFAAWKYALTRKDEPEPEEETGD